MDERYPTGRKVKDHLGREFIVGGAAAELWDAPESESGKLSVREAAKQLDAKLLLIENEPDNIPVEGNLRAILQSEIAQMRERIQFDHLPNAMQQYPSHQLFYIGDEGEDDIHSLTVHIEIGEQYREQCGIILVEEK